MSPDAYLWVEEQGDLIHPSMNPSKSQRFRSVPLIDPARINMAWVIMCNDSVEGVYIGSEQGAEKRKRALRDLDIQRQKQMHGSSFNEDEYLQRLYWHTRLTTATIEPFDPSV